MYTCIHVYFASNCSKTVKKMLQYHQIKSGNVVSLGLFKRCFLSVMASYKIDRRMKRGFPEETR